MLSRFNRVRLFAILQSVAHRAPPSMGFSRQEYWSGLPFPSPADLPNPRIEPRSPVLQAGNPQATSRPPGKPYKNTTKAVLCPSACPEHMSLCLSRPHVNLVVVQSFAHVWPHRLQHTRLSCPSPSSGACSNSRPSSQWRQPTMSSSAIPFSSCLQSFPASGSFLKRPLGYGGVYWFSLL